MERVGAGCELVPGTKAAVRNGSLIDNHGNRCEHEPWEWPAAAPVLETRLYAISKAHVPGVVFVTHRAVVGWEGAKAPSVVRLGARSQRLASQHAHVTKQSRYQAEFIYDLSVS